MLGDLLGRFSQIEEKATVKTAFGDAVHGNGRTIIPVAKVAYGFGFGGGRGPKREEGEKESGEGGGGGLGISVRPVAILEIDAKATRIRPVIDVNRLVLAGMLLAAWNVFWVTLTIRATAKRRHE